MDGFSITEGELQGLEEKLDALVLTEAQRTVLDAMRKLARDLKPVELTKEPGPAEETPEPARPAFAADFADAFTPAQAGVVVAYAAAPAVAHSISRSYPAGVAVPAIITS